MSRLPVVASSDGMDDEVMIKHLNARHMPIGTMQKIVRGPLSEAMYTYHDYIHRKGFDDHRPVNHTHARSTS